MAKEFMNITELSECLSVKRSTLYRMVQRGAIPCFKFGRLLRFKRSEIDLWVEKQKEPVIEVKIEARKVLRSIEKKSDLGVDEIVKKAIEDTNKKRYNSWSQEKPGGIEGLETEVNHGIV